MPLQDAVEIDLVVKKQDKQTLETERELKTKKMQIVGIIDPRTGQQMPLADAIREGLFDETTGENNFQ